MKDYVIEGVDLFTNQKNFLNTLNVKDFRVEVTEPEKKEENSKGKKVSMFRDGTIANPIVSFGQGKKVLNVSIYGKNIIEPL